MYNHEDEIFTDFRVPAGLDKDTAIHKILFDNAELGLIYTDPEIFPVLIKNWTDSNFYSWERAYQALHSQYNPIHNYDRNEEWTDSGSGTDNNTESVSGSDTDKKKGKITETPTTKRTHHEAGYNEGNSPVYAYDDEDSGTKITESEDDDTYTYNHQIGDAGSHTSLNNHEGRTYGNIGVTTTQKMIEEEMELRTKYNIYDMISMSFRSNFCIMVY